MGQKLMCLKLFFSAGLISINCSASDLNIVQELKSNQISSTKSEVSDTASQLFRTLDSDQIKKAAFKLNSKEMAEWRYFPSPSRLTKLIFPDHHGVSVAELNSEQKEVLQILLQSGLSNSGLDAVDAALTLDKNNTLKFRGLVNWLLFDYNPNNYFISFFGKPTDPVWAWRFEGHHISLTFNVSNVNQKITVSPAFIGTTANKVVIGTKAGVKEVEPLKPVIQNIKSMASSLDKEQILAATQSLKKVPKFNLFAPGIFGGPLKLESKLSKGLALSQMSELQKKSIMNILVSFQTNFKDATSENNLMALKNENFENVELIWSGDLKMESPFYIRIQGATFIFELNCSENDANHYHTVWINR